MEAKASPPRWRSIIKIVLYLVLAVVTVSVLLVLYFAFVIERDIHAASTDSRPAVDATGAYHAPNNLFSAQLPDGWEINEDRLETPGASFFSPAGGDSIAVYYYRSHNIKADALLTLSTAIVPDMDDPQPSLPIDPRTGKDSPDNQRA